MSNQPRKDNPARTIRVSDQLWAAVKAQAREKDQTVSEVVREFLAAYADRV